MKPEWCAADLMIEADAGRLALRRGLLVYAVEQADNLRSRPVASGGRRARPSPLIVCQTCWAA